MEHADSVESSPVRHTTILVVEDDVDIRGMLSDLLAGEGYSTILLSGSEHAHEVITRDRPDLILLDIWLEKPDSGWQLLERVRADEELAKIPVIVFSAHSYMLSTMAAWLGESHYVFVDKPFDPDDMLRRIRAALLSRAG
jgi:DNA-binding response OmpR family regulator